uniref:Uncharacterized protein n=1 Tax=Helianthus annuus TaxID=4232 RepID=A0A251SQP3_HELAN
MFTILGLAVKNGSTSAHRANRTIAHTSDSLSLHLQSRLSPPLLPSSSAPPSAVLLQAPVVLLRPPLVVSTIPTFKFISSLIYLRSGSWLSFFVMYLKIHFSFLGGY